MSAVDLNEEIRDILKNELGPKVYAIQIGADGPIKIGVANNINRRLSTLQTACPWQMYLRGWWSAAWSSEALAHHTLARYRIRGEWFKPHRAVLTYIATRTVKD